MQNLTTTQKSHLYHGGHVGVAITGETLDGVAISVTEDDIIEGSFSIDRNWSHGSTIEIGCADTSELVFELDNSDGRWNAIRLEGTRLTVVLDIAGEPLQAGIFTVDEPPRKLTTMQIRALDDMARFNRPYVPGIAYPATLRQILIDCCQQCGVALHTTEFVNDDYVVSQQPEGDDITFHHIVAWVAELAGCNAWIDHLARLRLSWYGENQPETPAMEFTRASTAYHPDTGAEVPEDTPVFVDFAAGRKGSLMVEGTENLIAEVDSEEYIRTAGDIYDYAYWVCYYGLEKSTTYTISFEAEFLEGQSDYITIFPYRMTGQRMSQIHIPYSSECRMTATFTTDDRYNYNLLIYAGRAGQTAGNRIKFKKTQLEKLSYSTPWHIGGGTRANPTKQIVLPEALPDEFGVGVRFKPLWDSETYDLMDYRTIFTMGDAITSNIVRVMRYTNNRWDLRVYADGVGAYTRLERSFNAGEIIGFYIVKKGTRAKVFYAQEAQENGESYESDWFSVGETFTNEKVKNISIGSHWLGGSSSGLRQAGGVIADFVLHDRPEDIDPEGYLSAIPGGGGE